jgi:thioredoxin 1
MQKSIIIISVILLSFGQSEAQTTDSVKYQSLEPYNFHLQYLRQDPALLIDVREFFEFKRNRIKDAVNIPSYGNPEFSSDTIDKNTALFFYCSTDFRSKRVAGLFYDKGFRELYNLDGGIVAWKKDGFPVEKGKIKRRKK